MTTIIGIDAATEAKKLGLACGRVDGGHLIVDKVVLGSEVKSVTATIASWITDDTLIAVDAPLGWPTALGQTLQEHRAGAAIEAEANELFRRETDRFVKDILGRQPLDVGADRIARTARAALQLLSELRQAIQLDIPLAWTPRAEGVACIEVYPVATLRARGVNPRGYKGRKDNTTVHRRRVIAAVTDEFHLGIDDARLVDSDDRLDAVLCVLAGADFLRSQCRAPDDRQRELAEIESWIWFKDPRRR